MPRTPRRTASKSTAPRLPAPTRTSGKPQPKVRQTALKRTPGTRVLVVARTGKERRKLAESVAAELDRDLVRVDFGQLESTYIGETEKNLEETFDHAEATGAILFFDEADALFGKRTEVNDAHDRYANLDVSYLIQRVERSPAVLVVGTSAQTKVDPKLLRRLRFAIKLTPPAPSKKSRPGKT